MIIDFHTHIFPEKIAKQTLDFLEARCHTKPATNGMIDGLNLSSINADITYSVVLPVVTNPKQFASILRFAAQINHTNDEESRLLSFGGIHPDSGNYKDELLQIKQQGLPGIKLHPDYQGVYFNDIRYKRIIDYASELGLIISVHAGFDPGYPDCTHCTPENAYEVIHEVQPEKMVLAHLGGFQMWDQVEEYLVGKSVYLDTAVIFDSIKEEQFFRIIRSHGVDRILFATDSPWADQKEYVEHIKMLNMTPVEKDLILYKNAQKLLNIS